MRYEYKIETLPMGYEQMSDIKPPEGEDWYCAQMSVGSTVIMDGYVPRVVNVVVIMWCRHIFEENRDDEREG